MDAEFFKAMGSMGVGGALGAFIFWFSHKASERHVSDLKGLLEESHLLTKQVLDVVRDNTVSNTRLITLVDAMHRRWDREHRGQE